MIVSSDSTRRLQSNKYFQKSWPGADLEQISGVLPALSLRDILAASVSRDWENSRRATVRYSQNLISLLWNYLSCLILFNQRNRNCWSSSFNLRPLSLSSLVIIVLLNKLRLRNAHRLVSFFRLTKILSAFLALVTLVIWYRVIKACRIFNQKFFSNYKQSLHLLSRAKKAWREC